jgi:POT family proton-dependent oligopeptide transporter
MHERDGTLDTTKVFWDDQFVDEIKASIKACQIFFIIPIFILADGGIGAMENAMSAGMRLDGAPNDVMNNFNSLAIIVAVPIMTYGLYPFFEKIGRPIKPMTRLFIGFQLGTINMIGGAIMQWKVYQTSPCGYFASDCTEGVSSVSLWWQLVLYGIVSLSTHATTT